MTEEQAMRLAGACERAVEIVEEAVATLSAARELFRSVHGAWLVGAELRDAVGYSRLAQIQMRMIHDKLAAGELTPSPTRPERCTMNSTGCCVLTRTRWHAVADRCGVPGLCQQAGDVSVNSASLAAEAVVATEAGEEVACV